MINVGVATRRFKLYLSHSDSYSGGQMQKSRNNKENLDFYHWYLAPPGSVIIDLERAALANLPVQFFGQNILQMGGPNDLDFSHLNGKPRQIYLNPDLGHLPSRHGYGVCGSYTELPFLPASIDAVFLFHVLEFSSQPRQVLREIYDALAPNGHLVIFSFNPLSLFGLARLFSRKSHGPWRNHYLRLKLLTTWLKELGFTVTLQQTMCFRPPFKSRKRLHNYLFMEGLGSMFWPSLGNVNLLLVQKKVVPLSLIKLPFWRRYLPEFANRCLKPTTRVVEHDG